MLPLPVVDEVTVFTSLVALAETDLASEISIREISCTNASPSGGGSSEAGVFKQKTLLPDAVEDVNLCGACETEMQEAARRTYPCPRRS